MLYAAADARDPDHAAAARTLQDWDGELVTSAFTAAEADHLILSRLGVDVELAYLGTLADQFTVPTLDAGGLRSAREVCARYRDLQLGLADASIVVLAHAWSTRALATFDERHFRAVLSLSGGAFDLFPAAR